MRTIGFINWKGGVGKTTASINTAHFFGGYKENVRVLFIDGDKQANSSYWFGADASKGSLTDILLNGAAGRDVIQKTRYPNIDIIASDESLIQANYSVLSNKEAIQHNILKNALQDVKFDYDICIIDNPPDSNLPVLNCMAIMDDIIAVTLPNRFSLSGVAKLQEEIDNYNRDLHLNLSIRGILVNQFSIRGSDILAETRQNYHFFPHLRGGKNTQNWLDRVINEQKSIFEISPNSGYARDLTKFAQKIEEIIMMDLQGKVDQVLW